MWNEANQILNQAAERIRHGMADFLPGLLAFVLVLVLALVIAWIVRTMVRRSLRRFDFDRRAAQWGLPALAEWSPSKSPTLLMARISFWTIVLLGALAGISALDANLTNMLTVRMFAYFPNVVAALFILIVGTFMARFLARGVLISAVNMQIQSARLLSLGVKWLVIVLAGAMALEHLGIGGDIVRLSFGILFGGIVLALALAVGLGSKDMVSRSWERQVERGEEEPSEQFHHL
jgi:Mechanosensitive ion channel, conserved TM helix